MANGFFDELAFVRRSRLDTDGERNTVASGDSPDPGYAERLPVLQNGQDRPSLSAFSGSGQPAASRDRDFSKAMDRIDRPVFRIPPRQNCRAISHGEWAVSICFGFVNQEKSTTRRSLGHGV